MRRHPLPGRIGRFAAGLLVFALTLPARAATPASAPATSPAAEVWGLLSDGKQREAEQLLADRLRADAKDAKAVFLYGLLTRSRFDKVDGDGLLNLAATLDPASDDAAAAKAMVLTDTDPTFTGKSGFDTLHALMAKDPDEPAYAWLLAIACRTANHNEEGVAAFEALGKHFKVGPVLFHQTYANLLDELGRYDQSLPHREMAIELEPSAWSYQAMGDTYGRMNQPALAVTAYQKSAELNPKDWITFNRLCRNAIAAKDAPATIAAAKSFIALRPTSADAHVYLANGLFLQKRYDEAADEFKAAVALRPGDAKLAAAAASVLRKAGRFDEATELLAARKK